jgi:hypothetical protein
MLGTVAITLKIPTDPTLQFMANSALIHLILYVKLHFEYVPLGDSCFVFFLEHHGFQVSSQVKIKWAVIWGPRRSLHETTATNQPRSQGTADPIIAARRYYNEVVPHFAENAPEILHPCLEGMA